jgi:hypothetical protein
LNLLRLAEISGEKEYAESAGRTLKAFSRQLTEAPSSLPQMLVALGFSLAAPKQITIQGRPAAADTGVLLRALRRRFVPYKTVSIVPAGGAAPATAVVCERQTCSLPVSSVDEFVKLLE